MLHFVPKRNRRVRTLVVTALLLFVSAQLQAEESKQRGTTDLLFEKAQFWYEHGQERVALQTYQRILDFEPTNIDALVGAANMALLVNEPTLVRGFVARLRAQSPDDPAVIEVLNTVARNQTQIETLISARHLASQGQRKEAAAKYRQVFADGKTPPDDLAGEYYQVVLQDLEDGSEESENIVDLLIALVQRHKDNPNYLLAQARCLIVLGEHRPEATDILAKLARNPAMALRVRPLWRNALLWSGIDVGTRERLLDYLSIYPSDSQLDEFQARMNHDLPSRSLMAVLLGNTKMELGQFADAEATYKRAIELDPTEPQAQAMMAVLLVKQNRNAEARPFAHRAAELQPTKADDYLSVIGEGKAGAPGGISPEQQRILTERYNEVTHLAEAGKVREAEALLDKLANGKFEDPGNLMLLADLRHRAGNEAERMALLLHAEKIAPTNIDVIFSLCLAQSDAGQLTAAHASYNRGTELLRRNPSPDKQRAQTQMFSDLLRKEALQQPDPALRIQMLRDALQQTGSAWTRLELARSLDQQSQSAEATAIITPLLRKLADTSPAASKDRAETVQAVFVWYQSRRDADRALQLARSVPETQRSPGMRILLGQDQLRHDIASALARPPADKPLLRLAAQPDPDGSRGVLIAHALSRSSGITAMRQALNSGLRATGAPANITKLRYASVLVEFHQFGAATGLLRTIDPSAFAAQERGEYDKLGDYLAAAEVEDWLRVKNIPFAEATLAKRKRRIAGSVVLQTAAARITLANGRTAQAIATLSALQTNTPNDQAVRGALIDALIAHNELDRAAALAAEGLHLNPDSPFLAMQAANIAQQQGHPTEALIYLRQARELHIEDMQRDMPLLAGG